VDNVVSAGATFKAKQVQHTVRIATCNTASIVLLDAYR
jgi:hypothetical protein